MLNLYLRAWCRQSACLFQFSLQPPMSRWFQFALANLAVCRAAAGDFPEAASLIKAARFYAASPHALAVISFNEALILLFENKTDDFFAKLNEAVEKSPRQIKRYCEFSTLLASIKNDGRYLAIKEKK